MRGFHRCVSLRHGDQRPCGVNVDLARGFSLDVALHFGDEPVPDAVVPEFRAVLVTAIVDMRVLRRVGHGGRIDGPEHDPGFEALTGKQDGHGLSLIGHGDILIPEHPAMKRGQRHADHAVPVRELDPGVAPFDAGDLAEAQGCAAVRFKGGYPAFKMCDVESGHMSLLV